MGIHISAMLPSKALEQSRFNKALTAIAIQIAKRSARLDTGMSGIDIVFLLPGESEKPNFDGLIIHSFDKKRAMINFKSSIPEKFINTSMSADYILAVLKDAVDEAEQFFKEQEMDFNAPMHMRLVDAIDPSMLDIDQ